MGNTRQLIPAARRDELVIQEVEGETLVYDLKSHKAHCLNETAAMVWKHCDGERTASEVALLLEQEMGTPVSAEVVRLAVEQLEKRSLLEESFEPAFGSRRISRRELARTLGVVTTLTLPFIASIKTQAAIQVAGSCGGTGAPCGAGLPACCPGRACNGVICQNT
ncbi:MAG TPA: PqqD family protein [Pyrinomonadaceae bacterium]|nr:PqqD family protein [Pyrinomonadaceae bacterium]